MGYIHRVNLIHAQSEKLTLGNERRRAGDAR